MQSSRHFIIVGSKYIRFRINCCKNSRFYTKSKFQHLLNISAIFSSTWWSPFFFFFFLVEILFSTCSSHFIFFFFFYWNQITLSSVWSVYPNFRWKNKTLASCPQIQNYKNGKKWSSQKQTELNITNIYTCRYMYLFNKNQCSLSWPWKNQ